MIEQDLESWLQLLSIPGIGPSRFRSLVQRLGSPDEVLKASFNKLLSVPGIDKKTAVAIASYRDDSEVKKQLNSIRGNQIGVISFQDKEYPEALSQIHAPPPLLFFKGSVELLNSVSVAVVGTRSSTLYGQLTAEKLSEELAKRDITVVSGMARGIDSVAHRAALEVGGKTTAVLGCGIDVVYPPENVALRRKIIKRGLLLSEFPPGTSPDAQNFPQRNRLISGLSLGVLIVEAGERSGALLTAEYALDQGREVFAVPGNIDVAKSSGTNALIKQGAKLVQTVDDILEELGPQFQKQIKTEPSVETPPDLPKEHKQVLESLSGQPKHIDKIIEETQLSSAQVSSALLSLELEGLARKLSGEMYIRG